MSFILALQATVKTYVVTGQMPTKFYSRFLVLLDTTCYNYLIRQFSKPSYFKERKGMRKTTGNELLSRLASGYIGVIASFFLLYSGHYGYEKILQTKRQAFLVISCGYILVSIFFLVELLIIGQNKLPKLIVAMKNSSYTQRAILGFAIITWLSAVFSPYSPISFLGASRVEGAITITIYCLCFLLLSIFGTLREWHVLLFGGATLVFDLICITQLHGYNPFNLYPEGYTYFDANIGYPGAYLGTIGNVDSVAAFLSIAIPIFFVLVVRLNTKWRYFLLIPLSTSVYVLFEMHVLAGLVGVILGIVLSLPVILPLCRKWKLGLAAMIFVGGVAVLILLFFVAPEDGLFYEIHEILHGRINNSFGSGRIAIWRAVIEKIPDHLWFGFGPDTMALTNLQPFTHFDEHLGILITTYIDVAHNEYLNILFHQGIFAFSAYLFALIYLAVRWCKKSASDGVIAALGSGVLCYCIQAFFGFSVCITAPYFWITLAMLDKKTRNGGLAL